MAYNGTDLEFGSYSPIAGIVRPITAGAANLRNGAATPLPRGRYVLAVNTEGVRVSATPTTFALAVATATTASKPVYAGESISFVSDGGTHAYFGIIRIAAADSDCSLYGVEESTEAMPPEFV